MRPFKLLKKSPEYWQAFKDLGNHAFPPDELTKPLESFVCAMYGKKSYCSVNKLRHDLAMLKFRASHGVLSSFEGTDLCFLPPCSDSLKQHIKRSNYQSYIWKNANIAFQELPSLLESGWTKESGTLEILWNESNIVPPELESVATKIGNTEENDDRDGDDRESDNDIGEDLLIDVDLDTDEDEDDEED